MLASPSPNPAASHSLHSTQPTAAACMHLPTLPRSLAALSRHRTFCTCWVSDQLLFQQSRRACKLHDMATTEGAETIWLGCKSAGVPLKQVHVRGQTLQCAAASTAPLPASLSKPICVRNAAELHIGTTASPSCSAELPISLRLQGWWEGVGDEGGREGARQPSAAPGFPPGIAHQPSRQWMDEAAALGAHHCGALASVEQAHPGLG